MALLGLTDEPAMLDGYGPIPPSMARHLIADGAESFHRVLIDPRDGAPLEIGRTSYRRDESPTPMAPPTGREVPVPRLQQPLPRQRSRPHPRLGQRRHHRDHQISASPATSTTDSDTPPAGNPPPPPRTNHPAGYHPPDGTTPANTPTGNHRSGRRSFSKSSTFIRWRGFSGPARPLIPAQWPAAGPSLKEGTFPVWALV